MQYSGSVFEFFGEVFSALPSLISSFIIYAFATMIGILVIKMFNR